MIINDWSINVVILNLYISNYLLIRNVSTDSRGPGSCPASPLDQALDQALQQDQDQFLEQAWDQVQALCQGLVHQDLAAEVFQYR